MIIRFVFFISFFGALSSCNNSNNRKAEMGIKDSNLFVPPAFISTEKKEIKNGLIEEKYNNGVLKSKGEYIDGKRHGPWIYFYSNGKPWSEGFFDMGIRTGKTIVYYENGNKRYEGHYEKDKQIGKWIFWDEKGKIVEERVFGKDL